MSPFPTICWKTITELYLMQISRGLVLQGKEEVGGVCMPSDLYMSSNKCQAQWVGRVGKVNRIDGT